jgi:hypothetical protein
MGLPSYRALTAFALCIAGGCGTVVERDGVDVEPTPDPGVPAQRRCEGPHVRPVYMVPADRDPSVEYSDAIRDALLELQLFFQREVATGESFCIDDVEVVPTEHTASWYMANPSPRGDQITFWDNALADAYQLTELKDGKPDALWLYFFDVDYVEGQWFGAIPNLVLLPSVHMRGIAGREQNPRCYYSGTIAYYLASASGVGRPQDCANGEPTCQSDSLMWGGYANFPTTFLLPDQKLTLAQSSLFVSIDTPAEIPSCAK